MLQNENEAVALPEIPGERTGKPGERMQLAVGRTNAPGGRTETSGGRMLATLFFGRECSNPGFLCVI